MVPTRTLGYQVNCLIDPIVPSVAFGGSFAAFDVFQGARFDPRAFGRYIGALYVYNVLLCPMEAIHGRQSLIHNVVSAGMIGYVGVQAGRLGIPFLDPSFVYRHKTLSPPQLAFMVYGGCAGTLAAFGGKRL